MKPAAVVLVVLVFSLVSGAFPQGSGSQPKELADLGRPVQVKLGHLVALTLNNVIEANMKSGEKWVAPVLVTFDDDADRLGITIFGGRNTIDSAKESLEDFRKLILGGSLELVNTLLKTSVTESLMEIEYVNRKTQKSMVVFKDGQYIIR